MSQIIYPRLDDLQRKMRSRRFRKKAGKFGVLKAREKLWLAKMAHRGTPGHAR